MTYENENKYTDVYDTTTLQVANDIHAESHGALSFEEANELAVQELRRIAKVKYEIRNKHIQDCRGGRVTGGNTPTLPRILCTMYGPSDTRRYRDF